MFLSHGPETRRKVEFRKVCGRGKEGSYLGGGKAGNAAVDFGDIEGQDGMTFGKLDELVHMVFYGLGTPVHGWNGVRLPLQADASAPYGSEFIYCQPGGTTSIGSGEVAGKDENLVRLQSFYA